jgi:hypothetical protein
MAGTGLEVTVITAAVDTWEVTAGIIINTNNNINMVIRISLSNTNNRIVPLRRLPPAAQPLKPHPLVLLALHPLQIIVHNMPSTTGPILMQLPVDTITMLRTINIINNKPPNNSSRLPNLPAFLHRHLRLVKFRLPLHRQVLDLHPHHLLAVVITR